MNSNQIAKLKVRYFPSHHCFFITEPNLIVGLTLIGVVIFQNRPPSTLSHCDSVELIAGDQTKGAYFLI